ncbi:MAG: hypothetical protein Q9161_002895 [Pseudevernia consocians]
MDWASKHHVEDQRTYQRPSGNEVYLSSLTSLRGQVKTRQEVASHVQVLKGWAQGWVHRRGTETAQYVNMKQSSKVGKPRPAVSVDDLVVLIASSEILRHFPAITYNPDSLSVHSDTSSAQDFLSLSSANRLYRTECLHYQTLRIRGDFGFDGHALQRFCSMAPAEALAAIYHLLSLLLKAIRTGFLTSRIFAFLILICGLVTQRTGGTRILFSDSSWGTQTETVLAALEVTLAVRAGIRLEMRWVANCERFGREYVQKGRWRRVIEGKGHGAPDQEGSFGRKYYDLCDNGKTAVKVTGKEESGLVLPSESFTPLPRRGAKAAVIIARSWCQFGCRLALILRQ